MELLRAVLYQSNVRLHLSTITPVVRSTTYKNVAILNYIQK